MILFYLFALVSIGLLIFTLWSDDDFTGGV